jgi:hypothetical protein
MKSKLHPAAPECPLCDPIRQNSRLSETRLPYVPFVQTVRGSRRERCNMTECSEQKYTLIRLVPSFHTGSAAIVSTPSRKF